jgi:hypothetical protein
MLKSQMNVDSERISKEAVRGLILALSWDLPWRD